MTPANHALQANGFVCHGFFGSYGNRLIKAEWDIINP
jgi:hypothetical protein